MPDQSPPGRVEHSNSYNIFILVLTVMSLVIMALLILPLPDGGPPGPGRLRQPHLRRLPRRFRVELDPRRAQARLLHRAARLARPAGVDPEPGPRHRQRRQRGCAPPARPAESSRPDHPAAARPGRQGPGAGRPQEPRPVRGLHHGPGRVHRARHVERARARVRELLAGRQHHDRRRRAVVGGRDDHDRRVRRQVSGHACSVASPASWSCSPASGSSARWPASSPASWFRRSTSATTRRLRAPATLAPVATATDPDLHDRGGAGRPSRRDGGAAAGPRAGADPPPRADRHAPRPSRPGPRQIGTAVPDTRTPPRPARSTR